MSVVGEAVAGIFGPPELSTTGRAGDDGHLPPFAVDTYAGTPVDGAFTLVTDGLSAVARRAGGRRVRQELLVTAWDRHRSDALYGLLLSLGSALVEAGEAAGFGDLVDLELFGDPSPFPPFAFLYPPVYHPEAAQELDAPFDGRRQPVELVWLVPVTRSEAALGARRGPEALDRLFDTHDPDLLDLQRPALV